MSCQPWVTIQRRGAGAHSVSPRRKCTWAADFEGMLEEIPLIFSSLHRNFDLLHHDSICTPKPNEEIQKFHHTSFSTYTSKLSKTKECTWGFKGAPEKRSSKTSADKFAEVYRAQAREGVPPTPTPLTAPGELGAVLSTTIRLTWLLCPGFKTTTLLSHIFVWPWGRGTECKGCGIWTQRDLGLHFNSAIYELLHSIQVTEEHGDSVFSLKRR